jgi:membrane protein
VGGQMESLAQQPRGSLGLGFAIGLIIALWSANNGMKAIIDAMNVAYNEAEGRSFIRLTMVSFMFTLGAIALLILALGAIVVLPIVLAFLGNALGDTLETVLNLARWPVLLLIVIFAVSVLYRYGPNRERAEWRWVTPGSLLASVVWIVASIGFSWYVANFGTYNETYGSLGAIIGFMVWMWISATIIIMGAELNSEIEHQTRRDSTTGRPLPMGARGARVADELGERRG